MAELASFAVKGRVVLITGAAAGIGLAIAEAFAAREARVVLVDRAPAVAEVAASLPGGPHLGVVADVTDIKAVQATCETARREFGAIDILVNNAGIVRLDAAEALAEAEWDATMAVNLKAPFLVAQAVGRQMLAQGRGRIINIASQAATVGLDRHVAYCASKAGVLGITHVLALEWGPRGITVNAISPTVVETELGRQAWAGAVGEAMKAKIPVRRFAQPAEIAGACLYLASDAAAMINGANLVIDGGYTIQ